MKPGFRPPMKATLGEHPPTGPGWVYEPKLDGIRVLAVKDGDRIELWSRNQIRQEGRFPSIAAAVARQPGERFTVDGEVVAFDGERTSFGLLVGDAEVAISYYVFDALDIDGDDLTGRPLLERKARLEEALEWAEPVCFSNHIEGDGAVLKEAACKRGWEGLMAKRADSPYLPGKRTRDWLKLKCVRDQELVIGGWTDPQGSRTGFGALLVGYYEDGDLVYAGKVGTGFNDRTLKDLVDRLTARARKTSPFTRGEPPTKTSHWVRPDLVAQVGFTEWTGDGSLRHPRFLGLRTDKAAKDVVREVPS
jgi:DNA ligase D-like protein (predicted ligase)